MTIPPPVNEFGQYSFYNFYETIRESPLKYKQLAYEEQLMTQFTCPLEGRLQAIWSQHNYFVYVLEGKKIWHTSDGSHEVTKGSCLFVRKGANIIEQFFDAEFCLLVFFVSDEFICETLRPLASKTLKNNEKHAPVIPVQTDATIVAFMHAMLPYFTQSPQPNKALLELKFRELLLNVAHNPHNREALSYFCSLLHEPASVSLRKIMEDNFSYNLKLEEYAQLCNRSLSAFKRDFQKIYGQPPGKWLLERRLAHAKMLLVNSNISVSEIAYDCGFENLSHFSRAFREYFGAPPISFRRQAA